MSRARGSFWRLVRSDLRLLFGRRRTLALLAGLALVPLLLAVVLFVASNSGMSGQGPGFIDRVTGNGLFLVIAALFMCLPFLLPLTIGITAGDAISGEAQAGTLRYVLTVPVARTRLLVAKALVSLSFALAAVLVITVVALAAGGAFFGFSEMTLLSGTTVSLGAGVARMLGVAAYVALSLTGLVAVGLFFSTLTEVPVGAMAATTVVAVVSSVLDTLPQLSTIHPYLLTHHWFDFAEFLRLEIDWGVLGSGLLVQLGWVAIFASLAWGRFKTADVTA
ncbi:ABC transporter permease [Tessaracoccus flavus]|uniref:ABC transporter permease n=1 Tax=Tessaracoccus flavus TaxID=1610493 RepID=A0A1Q2CGH1_9ACTN|nr:ABC transporter permease [Tessaracoccus flavus]AQP45218.1 ABC transporter permease [Tessaracoccus flavus]SDY52612.1 ABC-2 type transport system permease protein [Tessaracoccus flavus]